MYFQNLLFNSQSSKSGEEKLILETLRIFTYLFINSDEHLYCMKAFSSFTISQGVEHCFMVLENV